MRSSTAFSVPAGSMWLEVDMIISSGYNIVFSSNDGINH